MQMSNYHPFYKPEKIACRSHFLLALFPEESQVQIIGTEMLELVMSLFSIANEPTLKIGFNSLCAGAEINQLHVEGIVLEDFLGKGAILPIERFKKKL